MTPKDAWVVADPTLCAVCGSESCENPDHLPPVDDTPPPTDGRDDDAAGHLPPQVAPIRREFRLYDDVELMQINAPPFHVEDRIVAQSLVVLYGPPDSYKTFSKITLELSVATGIDWFGARVLHKGPVVACVAEGMGRYKYRIAAAKVDAGFKLDERVGVNTIPGAFSLLDPGAVRAFIDFIRPLSPTLVSFDPLVRFMIGGSDSEPKDMARVVHACGLIQDELGSTVTVVHHTGWDESRERGSNQLRAAADTVLSQKDEDGAIVLTCEKQKDLDDFAPIRLVRQVVPVFDGTTCLLKLAPDRSKIDPDGLTVKHAEALAALRQCFPFGASHAQWKKALPVDYPERTLYRAEQALVAAGLVRRDGTRRPVYIPLPDT